MASKQPVSDMKIAECNLAHRYEGDCNSDSNRCHKKNRKWWQCSRSLIDSKGTLVQDDAHTYSMQFQSDSTLVCTHKLGKAGCTFILRNMTDSLPNLLHISAIPELEISKQNEFLVLAFHSKEDYISWETKIREKLQVYSFEISIIGKQDVESGEAVMHISSKYVFITKCMKGKCSGIFLKSITDADVLFREGMNGKPLEIEYLDCNEKRERLKFLSKHGKEIQQSLKAMNCKALNNDGPQQCQTAFKPITENQKVRDVLTGNAIADAQNRNGHLYVNSYDKIKNNENKFPRSESKINWPSRYSRIEDIGHRPINYYCNISRIKAESKDKPAEKLQIDDNYISLLKSASECPAVAAFKSNKPRLYTYVNVSTLQANQNSAAMKLESKHPVTPSEHYYVNVTALSGVNKTTNKTKNDGHLRTNDECEFSDKIEQDISKPIQIPEIYRDQTRCTKKILEISDENGLKEKSEKIAVEHSSDASESVDKTNDAKFNVCNLEEKFSTECQDERNHSSYLPSSPLENGREDEKLNSEKLYQKSVEVSACVFATKMESGGIWTIGVIFFERKDIETLKLLTNLEKEFGREQITTPRSVDAFTDIAIRIKECAEGFKIISDELQTLNFSDLLQLGPMKWIVAEFLFLHTDEKHDLFNCKLSIDAIQDVKNSSKSQFTSPEITCWKKVDKKEG